MNKPALHVSFSILQHCNRQSSVVNRQLAALILFIMPLISCGRYQARQELTRNQFFVETLMHEDRRWIAEDGFFKNNLLANPDSEVRQWSAIALGRIACPRALPLLYKALHTGDVAVRAASAFAIGEIEDRELLEKQYLDPDPEAAVELSRLLDDPSLAVRMRAVEALGKIGHHADAVKIVQQLNRFAYGGLPAECAYLEFSITALARLNDPAAVPVLERLAGADDSEIRWRALDALIRLQSKASRNLFTANLENPNPDVRSYAARGLGITRDPSLAIPLLPLLPPRSGQTGESIPLSVRFAALEALGELKNPAAIPSIKAALAAEPIDSAHPDQQNFAVQAAAAMGTIGAGDAEAVLLPLLKFSGPLANNAVIALAKTLKQTPARFFSLVDSSQFATPSALPAWAQAMAEMGGPGTAKELNRILVRAMENSSVSDMGTLPAILAALVKIDPPGLQETLSPFLGAHDAALLRIAVAAYRPKPGAKEPWAPIVHAVAATSSSRNIEARIDILSSLRPWVQDVQVQQLLRSDLKDPELSVRLVCAGLLRRAGVTDIPEDLGSSNSSLSEEFARAMASNRKNSTIAILETTRGVIEIELFREDAPVTVASFVLMALAGAYDGLEFDQIIPSQVIEGRSPATRPGFSRTIPNEVNMRPFERGRIGAALTARSSDLGRFFITLAPQPYLDGINTCFGSVVSGMQVADRIVPGDRIKRIVIKETISTLDYRRY